MCSWIEQLKSVCTAAVYSENTNVKIADVLLRHAKSVLNTISKKYYKWAEIILQDTIGEGKIMLL